MDFYSNNELLNYDVITPTVLTETALLYFHTPDEPLGETICCVIKPCSNNTLLSILLSFALSILVLSTVLLMKNVY